MTFAPVVAGPGLVGWRFLERTFETQSAVFEKSPVLARDVDYFRENIKSVQTAEDLVSDRRLLTVALGAFGLGDDVNNRYFIQRILEDGTTKDDALANRLSDSRYTDLSAAFAFGDRPIPRTQLSSFADEITAKYLDQEFEVAVGKQDDMMRLGLNMKRALPEILAADVSDETKWFRIMGTPPLRQVFEVALGLPSSFAQIDIEQQLTVLQETAARRLDIGSLNDLVDEEKVDKLITNFMVRSQLTSGGSLGSGSIALTLLSASPFRLS